MDHIRLKMQARHHILKSFREKKGLNQPQMAVYCNVPLGVYGNAERLNEIAPRSARLIADAVEMSVEALFPEWLEIYTPSKVYIILDDSAALGFGGSKALLQESFTLDLEKELHHLSDNAKLVIILSYGLNGHSVCDADQIGGYIGVGRGRILQIKQQALRTLRSRASMRDYVGDY